MAVSYVTKKRWKWGICVCECTGTDLHSTPSHFQRFHRQLQSAVRRRGSAVCYNLVASVLIYEGMEAKMAGVIVVGERKSTD